MRDLVRRVGQRFMVGFEGQAASADVKALIREFGVGHVVLFGRNVAAPEQVADLVRELQAAARGAAHERPLLIAVDQEGGRVARLKEPWTVWPAARAVGRTGSADDRARDGPGARRGAPRVRDPLRLRARASTSTRIPRTP